MYFIAWTQTENERMEKEKEVKNGNLQPFIRTSAVKISD